MSSSISDYLFPRKAFCIPDCYCCAGRAFGGKNIRREARLKEEPKITGIANKTFKELSDLLENAHYLPKDRMLRLVYFCVLTNKRHTSPFKAEHQDIMESSDYANRVTAGCLNFGICFSPFLGCTAWFGLLPLARSISPLAASLAPTSIAACTSGCNSLFSFIVTGTNPDDASNKANTKQDLLNGPIKDFFANAAMDLVDLKEINPLLAEEIATTLDVTELQRIVNRYSYEAGMESLVKPLKTAQRYILGKNLGNNPSPLIRGYIGKDYCSLKESNDSASFFVN